jgi:hypothetical protein
MIGHSQPFAMNSGPRYAVRFLSQWQSYFRGDVASFPRRMAARLVERGKAEPVNIAKPEDSRDPPENAQWTIRIAREPPRRASVEDIEDL